MIASGLRSAKYGSGNGGVRGTRSPYLSWRSDFADTPVRKNQVSQNTSHRSDRSPLFSTGTYRSQHQAGQPAQFSRGLIGSDFQQELHRHQNLQITKEHSAGGRFPAQPRLLGALALLHNPSELDGEGLGKAAAAAARQGVEDDDWWSAITARAKALAPSLALHDTALVLNGMARARRLDKQLVELLLSRVSSQMVYLTSAHLAMIASAVAKADVHNPQFVGNLTRELKARLMEFHSSMELTMIINSVSKLRVSDEELYRRFATHIQGRMGHEAFHVRDLSVIVSALARVNCTDAVTVSRFANCALNTLGEATPLELARLLHSCISVSCRIEGFFNECVEQARQQTLSMDPAGLSAAAFSFGQCLEAADIVHLPYLRQIFHSIRLASVSSLPLFLPREIVGVLRTYSRWQITFDCDHLHMVADRMYVCHSQFDLETSISALYALAQLMQRNARRSAAPSIVTASWGASDKASRKLLEPVWVAMKAGQLEIPAALRALEAFLVLSPSNDAFMSDAVSVFVARKRNEFDAPACAALFDTLSQLGRQPEEDVMMVLAERMTLTPT